MNELNVAHAEVKKLIKIGTEVDMELTNQMLNKLPRQKEAWALRRSKHLRASREATMV